MSPAKHTARAGTPEAPTKRPAAPKSARFKLKETDIPDFEAALRKADADAMCSAGKPLSAQR
eukprot:6422586-Alexandrium_andersonii.AAC.1